MKFSVERRFHRNVEKCMYHVLIPKSELTEEEQGMREVKSSLHFPLGKIGDYEEHILCESLHDLRPHLSKNKTFGLALARQVANLAFPEVKDLYCKNRHGTDLLPFNYRKVPKDCHSNDVREVEFDVSTL